MSLRFSKREMVSCRTPKAAAIWTCVCCAAKRKSLRVVNSMTRACTRACLSLGRDAIKSSSFLPFSNHGFKHVHAAPHPFEAVCSVRWAPRHLLIFHRECGFGVDASIKLSQVSHQILSHLVNGFSLTQLWISLMVLRVRLFLSWVWLWVF